VSLGKPQLPIQEDETALVLWALWRHYLQYRDIEFVRPLWVNLITRAADFLVRFRDPDTRLPLPSYDLWEERWGVHAFTVATVYGGLQAAWQFAVCFGDTARAATYSRAADEVREAFCSHFWSAEHDRFLRRIVPLDHDRTARLMAEVIAGRAPRQEPAEGAVDRGERSFERDTVIDSSMYAIFGMGLLNVHDARVEKTMKAIETRLWVNTDVGGLARYEGDHYQATTTDFEKVPGNPWFICTLWLAEWKIARARDEEELREALPILDWVASHALPSGILAEQVHPQTNVPLSVSPLTWSHATVISTLMSYLGKLEKTQLCPTCGQARQCRIGAVHHHESPVAAA
jgi:GH15 family glucan-1,4-alpha-glucosidase